MSPGEIMEKIESGVEELCAQHEHSMELVRAARQLLVAGSPTLR